MLKSIQKHNYNQTEVNAIQLISYDFYPRGASDARVIAIIVCLSVCHTPLLYQNG